MNFAKANITVTSRDVSWARFIQAAQSFKSMRTEVGLPEKGNFKRNLDSRVKSYKKLILVALYNEFGSPEKNLPGRALFRKTFASNKKHIQRKMNAGARDIVLGKTTVEAVLADIGDFLTQKIRDNIARGIPPQNAPRTIKRKGFNHPLLETGQLYDNIQHREVRRVGL